MWAWADELRQWSFFAIMAINVPEPIGETGRLGVKYMAWQGVRSFLTPAKDEGPKIPGQGVGSFVISHGYNLRVKLSNLLRKKAGIAPGGQ